MRKKNKQKHYIFSFDSIKIKSNSNKIIRKLQVEKAFGKYISNSLSLKDNSRQFNFYFELL